MLGATLDVAVLVDPIGDPRLKLIPLGSQRNVWAGPPSLVARASASAGAMAALTVISTPPPTSIHRNTLAWFVRLGRMPGPLCLCTSVNAAAQLAAAEIGIGIFPERMIEAYRAQGVIATVALPTPLPPGHVFIGHRPETETDWVDAVAMVIESVTRQLGYFDGAT